MPRQFWSGNESRGVITRIIVEGDLVLQTPAHFGNGDGDDLTDMPLLADPSDEKTPLLTGTSIAGALRSYLREREEGYGRSANPDSASVLLFGGLKGSDKGEQSSLIVDDAYGEARTFGIEMRDGVRICPDSRTAEEDKLFNLQLWQAGTKFRLRFELLIRASDNANRLKQALITALAGLKDGSITLGARKRRGYGRVNVLQWYVKTYDLTNPPGLLDWIEHGDERLGKKYEQPDLEKALDVAVWDKDHRRTFDIHAEFSLNGSLLIRSGNGEDDKGPDMVHLHAQQANGSRKPILSGTSLGGALRARALKIANTIGPKDKARELIHAMFGPEMKGDAKPWTSRVGTCEKVVENAKTDLVQNRVSIDRFTGGARETALFNEQPAFGGGETTVTVDVRLIEPQCYEVGLLLLLLKDLWTSDLPLGGESSVGRGRLKGKEATLTCWNEGTPVSWEIKANDQSLTIDGDREVLEGCVTALNACLKG
jgi:CRISPR/Cas system CSM-associated protein Csm3 (group 7 of RAMP superfamily)